MHHHRSRRFSLAILALPLLGLGPCIGDFDLGVGAFEVGQREALLWTHAVRNYEDIDLAAFYVEVATDPGFANIVRIQPVLTSDVVDYTARARVKHLQPGTQYYYRFKSQGFLGSTVSDTGAFRTAPPENDRGPVRFVISGDSNIGYTTANGFNFYVLSDAAAQDPDFFVYFGDTIYADSGILPGGISAFTLDEYREVHKLTRADAALQELLRSTGTFSGWDDHEVVNDYDGETVDPVQQANGYQAFFEYLPVRQHPTAAAGPFRTDRRVRWGRHLELFLVDGRQFRSAEQFCNPVVPDGPQTPSTLFSPFVEDEMIAPLVDPVLGTIGADLFLKPSDPDCVANVLADPTRENLGATQLAELKQALLDSDATFKVIVNNVPISSLLVTPYDRWEGYLAERQDLLDFIAANLDPTKTLVLTTDFHTNLAVQRDELTEVVVGPIGQTTFATSVGQIIGPLLINLLPDVLDLLNGVIDEVNGGTDPSTLERILGSEEDAFSYAVVEVFEDAGTPKLRVTIRGDTTYALGNNDPADVVDLFTFEMP